jgi:tetratricopeptide (TPR) repeat protein
MTTHRNACAALVALCLLQATARSSAQAVDDFTRGLAALSAGNASEAVVAFERAYAQTQRPVALVNLGIAQTQLGRIAEAIDALQRYVTVADPVADAKNITAVQTEIARLRAQLPPTPSAAPTPLPPASTEADAAPASEPQAAPPATPCSFRYVCLGPVLALGLPNLVGGGLEVRVGDHLGAAIGFQILPTVPLLHLGSLRATLFTAEARVYPFGGAFFLAAGFAHQAATATAETDDITAEASASIPTIVLRLGWLGRHGAVLGLDLGVLIPLGRASATVDTLSSPPMGVTPAEIAEVEANARRSAQDFVDYLPALFQLNALRLGYLF